MDYKEIIAWEIKNWNVYIDEHSSCWSRMHVHVKERRICKFISKDSYSALLDLLHEIGHIETDRASMKRAESESEATLWAINRLKELGLPIKRKPLRKYKDYIRMTYDRGIRRGLQKRIKSKLYI